MITFSNLRQWALSVCIAAFALGYTNSVTAKMQQKPITSTVNCHFR